MKLFPHISPECSPGPWWQWAVDNAALSRPQITAAARLFTLRRNSMTLSSSIQHNYELTPAITVMSRARDASYYLQLDCWTVQCLRRWIKCALLVCQSHLNLASFFVYTSRKYFLCAPTSKWKWDGSMAVVNCFEIWSISSPQKHPEGKDQTSIFVELEPF